ncbi:MAG: tetratricopeptide repeat protein [Deltaproteobacteria bacterium]|nr:tetratricopeptide repeat protein [Deltaproteobacteria bacterium]MDH3929808.1 tetratricopeptide repeat protein [Deltaproteobacteria bacterium]
MDFEEKLIQDIKAGNNVSLERGLLIISGLKTEGEIRTYTQKLDQIYNGFIEKLTSKSPVSLSTLRDYMAASMAKSLFEYLWNTKPKRCDGNFLLTDVIEAQLDPDVNQKVGSCVGLTALFTVLGLREGLNLTILVSDSHIVNRLRVDDTIYNVDNTDSLGFDYSINEKDFLEYPSIMILANVLNSRGMDQEGVENFEQAEADYNKAIEINPEYANAYNNRGNIKAKQADYKGAIEDYNRAIELNSQFVEAYCNRGIAKENLGDHYEAMEDFDRAIELNSEYIDGYLRRGILKQDSGDYAGAIRDFDRAIEVEPESKDRIVGYKERAERLQKGT